MALSLRKISALAFLPPAEICNEFIALATNISNEVEPMYKYFGVTYVLRRPIIARGSGPRRNQLSHPIRLAMTVWSIHHLQA